MTTIIYIGGERKFLQENSIAHKLPRVLTLYLGRDYIGAGFNGYAKYVSLYVGEGSYVDDVDGNLSPFDFDVGFKTLIPLNKDIDEHDVEDTPANEAKEWEADTQSSEPSTESSETDTYSRAEEYSYYTTEEEESQESSSETEVGSEAPPKVKSPPPPPPPPPPRKRKTGQPPPQTTFNNGEAE